jgi:hypothetical protein
MAGRRKGIRAFSKDAERQAAALRQTGAKSRGKRRPAAQAATAARRTLRDTEDAARETTERGAETARDVGEAGEEMIRRGADAARDTAESGAEAMREGADAASQSTWRVVESVTRQAAQVNRAALEAAEVYQDAARDTAADVRALAELPKLALSGAQELREAWSEWLARAARNQARVTNELFRVSNFQELAEVQSSFMKETVSTLLESSADMLRIASRISQEALRPLEERQHAR